MSAIDHLVIVAGGMGTRLAGVHGAIPKALVPIGGRPLLQHHLELASRCGIREVTVFAGYLAEQIETFLSKSAPAGLRCRLVVEREPMGTAGAVVERLDELPTHFLVLYGDVMTSADLSAIARVHHEREADFTAMVHPNDHPLDSDLLELGEDGRVQAIHVYPHPEGSCLPNRVNAALYAVRRDALRRWLPARKLDFVKDILVGLAASGARVFGYESHEYLKDMGTPARLQQVEADWQSGRIRQGRGGQPTVFLDRDGTLNVERGHLRRAQDLTLMPGAAASLRRLRQSGFRLVLLTNQPVIARGEATEADVGAIHQRLEWELGIGGAFLDAIYVCPHHPDGGFAGERRELKITCECRKPATGLFRRACADMEIDVSASWMVGDSWRDVAMARAAGLRSVLIDAGDASAASADFVARDIAEAAALIVEQRRAIAA